MVAAVEYACDNTPSLLLPASDTVGALYQGGFKAVGNLKFMAANNVTLIVNTAKVVFLLCLSFSEYLLVHSLFNVIQGLGNFFPKFNKYVESAKQEGIRFLDMNWVDDRDQVCTHYHFIQTERERP